MMQFVRSINVVDVHTAGEPVRVVVSGLPKIPGSNMLDKMEWFDQNLNDVRNFLMREPRGHKDMFGAILTPPVTEDGHTGVLYTHTTGQATMCGHGTIGVVKVLIETGAIPVLEGENIVNIDAPAGRVTARALVKNGRVREVSFQNVPSFLFMDNIEVNVPTIGRVKVAVSFGGGFYIFVEAEDLGLKVIPEHGTAIAKHSMWLKDWGNRELNVVHPENPGIKGIYGVIVTGPSEKTESGWRSRETCVFADSAIDRSPCGTGTSARMALLYGRGQMLPGEILENKSILNTTFYGSIDGLKEIGGIKGIVPRIAGPAWITGFNQLVLDPEDPLNEGFLI
jgi:trans-L-3-hydroxyproline dehydratase